MTITPLQFAVFATGYGLFCFIVGVSLGVAFILQGLKNGQ
jgi:hypothetical protein